MCLLASPLTQPVAGHLNELGPRSGLMQPAAPNDALNALGGNYLPLRSVTCDSGNRAPFQREPAKSRARRRFRRPRSGSQLSAGWLRWGLRLRRPAQDRAGRGWASKALWTAGMRT